VGARRAAAEAVDALGPIERILVLAKLDQLLEMADAPPTQL
jgi:hypothetical protein